jgi:hypothetical protein
MLRSGQRDVRLRGSGRGVLFDLEGRPASAGRNDVRIIDLEARPLQPFDVVDLRAEDELHADFVDDDGDAIDLEDVIVVLGTVEGERVLEAGATAAANGDAQRLALGVVLTAQQLADLPGRLVGKDDRLLWSLGHFIKCSGRPAR